MIVEHGRHDDLLEQEGVYASMWEQQQKSLQTDATPTHDATSP